MFLIAVATLVPVRRLLSAPTVSVPVLVALLVCLIPTTIGGLLPAIGIAGMDRAMRATSGRQVGQGGRGGRRRRHPAARQDRHHHARQPPGHRLPPAARRRRGASSPTPRSSPRLADETPEGRSIVVLAKERRGLRGARRADARRARSCRSPPRRASAASTIRRPAYPQGRRRRHRALRHASMAAPARTRSDALVGTVARGGGDAAGGRATDGRVLGVVHLKDIVKGGIKERFAALRAHGHPHRA
ncbi:MAG: hypothetical protein MZV65_26590 [Chromatiales bacterium]|nr:hypothetical protein [Chromatiales bacterium]